MKIKTFSVVVGGKKCNAKCPYCVSKMTKGICKKDVTVNDINVRNFRKGCLFARNSGVSTVLLTGVGEPLLYDEHIDKYLKILQEYDFPFIELQTNGIELHKLTGALGQWYGYGLNTVSLSVAHWLDEENQTIFGDKWRWLGDNIELLHNYGYTVRVSCIMVDGMIDSVQKIKEMIEFCRSWKVEQLTCRPVGMPEDSKNKAIQRWVKQHSISKEREQEIATFFKHSVDSNLLLELPHGANVYDYDGQNISINNCLTHSPNPENVRQLIFADDGHLRYSWTHKGAILL